MKITFGCIIIYHTQILLVKERSKKSKQLEKLNLLSGTVNTQESIFRDAIKREIKEEAGIDVELKGIVAVYESITPVDSSYYFVVGCNALSHKIITTDKEVIEARFFDLKDFFQMNAKNLVHKDMKLVTRNFLNGKFIDLIRSVTYK